MENDAKVENDFKVNIYFSNEESIEELLASYLNKTLSTRV